VAVVGLLFVPSAAALPAGPALAHSPAPPIPITSVRARAEANLNDSRHWVDVNHSTSVGPPSEGMTAYDPALAGIVAFGGYVSSVSSSAFLNGTWVFRSDRWVELCSGTAFNDSCPTAPEARTGAVMAYDTSTNELLLFGGYGDENGVFTEFSDTWALRNSTWVQLLSSLASVGYGDSSDGTMVNDPAGGYVYLDLPDQPSAEAAFDFENGSWVHAAAPPLEEGVIYYDPAAGELRTASPAGSGPTYDLGTQGWVASTWATSPLNEQYPDLLGAGFDPLAGEELAYVGGYTVDHGNWSFSERTVALGPTNWTDLTGSIAGTAPYPLYGANSYTEFVGFEFDPSLGATVLTLLNASEGPDSQPSSSSTWALTDPLNVSLQASVPETDVGLGVQWTMASTGGWGSIEGDFETGGLSDCWGLPTSLAQNCTYSAAGTYSVVGQVTDPLGDAVTATSELVVHADPQAFATSSEGATTVGATVQFTGSWSNGTPPLTGSWSFGDGSVAASPDPAHSYTAPGDYGATWSIQDAVGGTSVQEVLVVVNPTLAVDASASRLLVDAGVPDQFSSRIVGGTSPDQVLWTFGDGAVSPHPNSTYAYPLPGDYLASVAVTDQVGISAAAHVYVDVAPAMVTAAGANLTTVPADTSIVLAAGAVGGTAPYSYWWELGDGAWGTAARFSHIYAIPGVYGVSVTVNDSAGSSQLDRFSVDVTAATTPAPPSGGPPGPGGPSSTPPPSEFPRLSQQAGAPAALPFGNVIVLAGIAAVLVFALGSLLDRRRGRGGRRSSADARTREDRRPRRQPARAG
jgi:hypothetical protein